MTQKIPFSNPKLNQVINPEQLNEIIEAILEGKYSWACVLILRFAGYNPLHYIPYRTYNRLLKENCQIGRAEQGKTGKLKIVGQDAASNSRVSEKNSSKILDLNYLEPVGEKSTQVGGGSLTLLSSSKNRDYYSLKHSVVPISNW